MGMGVGVGVGVGEDEGANDKNMKGNWRCSG